MRKLIKNNAATTVRIILEFAQIKYSNKSMIQLKEHPEYPNLFAVKHTLKRFRIQSSIGKTDYSGLLNVPTPFILHTKINDGMLLPIVNVTETDVHILNEKKSFDVDSAEHVKNYMSGLIMSMDFSQSINEKNYVINSIKQPFNKFRKEILILSLIAIFLIIGISYWSLNTWMLFGASLLGFAAAIIIQEVTLQRKSQLGNLICGKSTKFDCKSILFSSQSSILGIAWADIGLVFFFVQALYLLLFPQNSVIVKISYLSGVLFVPYSIFIQTVKFKKWCKLCILVIAIILIGAMISYLSMNDSRLHPSDFFSYFIVLIFSILLWSSLKTMFINNIKIENYRYTLNQFKFNPNIISAVFSERPSLKDVLTTNINPYIGSPVAETTITLIISPTCFPCIQHMKTILENPIEGGKKIEFVFLVDYKNDLDVKIATVLMAIFTYFEELWMRSLKDYFLNNGNNPDKWLSQYESKISYANYIKTESILSKNQETLKSLGITSTPKALLNYKLVPKKYYTVDDMMFI